jgi:hypothetical protein
VKADLSPMGDITSVAVISLAACARFIPHFCCHPPTCRVWRGRACPRGSRRVDKKTGIHSGKH